MGPGFAKKQRSIFQARRVMTSPLVAVFGGSGFLGRYAVRALAKRGYRIRVGVRRPNLANFLLPMGQVGQIQVVKANLLDPDHVTSLVSGAEAVVNLVGILRQSGRQRFMRLHRDAAGELAKAAMNAGASTFVQVSALGASQSAPALYARSKAEGELRVREAFPAATLLRPSLLFGPEDQFFNRFAGLARFSPALPLIGGGETRFQPVFVGDVAEAIAQAVDGNAQGGTIYELGGPEVKTFEQLLRFVLTTIGRKRLLVPIPFFAAKIKAALLQFMPKPPLTPDQVELLKADNVVSEAAKADRRTLQGLGIEPESVEAIVPSYLWRFRKTGQFRSRMA